MAGEVVLDEKTEKIVSEEERGPLGDLEERVGHLLKKYQGIKKERDDLAAALDVEKEKMSQLEKKMEMLSQDREKVKTRIDQLLHRLKSVDI
jgi:chromosome segregation ATPase